MGRKGKSEEGKNLGGGHDDDGGGSVVVEWVGLGYVVCLVDVPFSGGVAGKTSLSATDSRRGIQ
jgi:hypothetical protein